MPIIDFPFRTLSEILLGVENNSEVRRPWINIEIINPHANISRKYCGLVDTGADSIMIPSQFAPLLGHDLHAGMTGTGSTAGGPAKVYFHTTQIKILDLDGNELLDIPETLIGFMEGLDVVLLGVRNFLSDFVLLVEYPEKKFSIRNPENYYT